VPRFLSYLVVVVSAVVLLGLGMYVGAHPDRLPTGVQNVLGIDASQRSIQEATDKIEDTYYRKIPKQALADAAIKGMVASLHDQFSNYFTKKEYADFKLQTSGQFSGVGMTVTGAPLGLKVSSTYPKSPARAGGLKPGDVITAVNGTPLKGKSETAATAIIKGPEGSKVDLTWVRDGKKTTKTFERKALAVPVVTSSLAECKDTKVAVVRLSSFTTGAGKAVKAAIEKQRKKGAKAIVLDLRENGGGLVTEAQAVSSLFLKNGKIVTTRGRDVPTTTLNATGNPIAPDDPLVVLVDGNSASASEITAGALQDRKRATLVGTHTYGKGIFQEVLPMDNGGAMDITAGQYFLPSGRNIGGKGVTRGAGLTPTVKTPPTDSAAHAREALRTAVCTAAGKKTA
jgi:carboxyl-terminal processing protease